MNAVERWQVTVRFDAYVATETQVERYAPPQANSNLGAWSYLPPPTLRIWHMLTVEPSLAYNTC